MDWPTVAELKLVLGVTNDARDSLLDRAMRAAIEQVCSDIGYADVTVDVESPGGQYEAVGRLPGVEADESPPGDDVVPVDPNASLSAAALLLATTVAKAPDAPFGVAAVFDMGGIYVARQNPNYVRLLKGRRVRFGVA